MLTTGTLGLQTIVALYRKYDMLETTGYYMNTAKTWEGGL